MPVGDGLAEAWGVADGDAVATVADDVACGEAVRPVPPGAGLEPLVPPGLAVAFGLVADTGISTVQAPIRAAPVAATIAANRIASGLKQSCPAARTLVRIDNIEPLLHHEKQAPVDPRAVEELHVPCCRAGGHHERDRGPQTVRLDHRTSYAADLDQDTVSGDGKPVADQGPDSCRRATGPIWLTAQGEALGGHRPFARWPEICLAL